MGWKRKQNDDKNVNSKVKHRVFCPDCGRSKLLFESKEKALNFIKFNGDAIEKEKGYKPKRVYQCVCCGGWHVTSHSKKPGHRSWAERYFGISCEDLIDKSFYYEKAAV